MTNYPKISDADFGELSIGFYPSSFDLHALDLSALRNSTRAWERVAGILLSCERGDFSALPELGPIMRDNLYYILWNAVTNISGYAGTLDIVLQTFDHFENKYDETFLYFFGLAAGATSNIQAIDYLMQAHSRTTDYEPMRQIELEISFLLEPEDGPLSAGAMEEGVDDDGNWVERINRDKYFGLVTQQKDALLARTGSATVPIFGGEVLNIIKVARRMYGALGKMEGRETRLCREQTLFEASTGINCSPMLDSEGTLKPLQAAGILEQFFDSDDIEKFVPGQRYFFGHPIST